MFRTVLSTSFAFVALTSVAIAEPGAAPITAPTAAPGQPPSGVPAGASNADAPAASIVSTTAPETRFAVAVNPPIRLLAREEKALAASVYVGFGGHHVVRGNVAQYPFGDVLASETSFDGTTTDVGASYQYFPRRVFDGYFVEAGLLYRHEDGSSMGPFGEEETETTTFYAARAMIGWSWLVGNAFFTSVQFGASFGHRSGTKMMCDECSWDEEAPMTTTRISEMTIAGEAMMRFGVAFDL